MAASLLILYGSQTGNAQDVAERLRRESRELGYAPRVLPMDAYPVTQLPQEKVVLFSVSTTGQGEMPDNMRASWKFLLRKSLPSTSLAHTAYAVFGLGDSGYVKYNVAAKKLDRRLAALGAQVIVERGLGDDQHRSGYEAALDPWLQVLWPRLLALHSPPRPALTAGAREAAQLESCRYRVTRLPREQWHAPPAGPQAALEQAVAAAVQFHALQQYASGMPPAPPDPAAPPHGPWRPFFAPLLSNTRIAAPTHFQDTRHIELDIRGSGMEAYTPGDVLAVLPSPPEADVDAFLRRLGWEGSCTVAVEAVEPPVAAPEGVAAPRMVSSLRAIAQGVLDIAGSSPRRYLFQLLQHFAATHMERDRLKYFGSAEGRDDLYQYNQREHRSLLEVLTDFPSAAPPLERLLEAAPLLQPRLFSLASCPAAHPGAAHITLAVVSYTTPYKRPKRGLCSHWLAGLQPGTTGAGRAAARVPVWVQRGVMRLPADDDTPMILVGPGTGVAPFRSFLQHRHAVLCARRQQQQQQPTVATHSPQPQEPTANGGESATGRRAAPDPAEASNAMSTSQAPPSLLADAGGNTGSASSPALTTDANSGTSSGASSSMLFFGCRSEAGDFYYRDEWGQLQAAGVLHPRHGLVTAFSRDTPRKVYVQDRIREHGREVWDLLRRGAHVYVCGSADKMPAAVARAFEEVVAEQGGMGAEDAARWVRQLELTGRYSVEAWS